jgi:hypothetical protein
MSEDKTPPCHGTVHNELGPAGGPIKLKKARLWDILKTRIKERRNKDLSNAKFFAAESWYRSEKFHEFVFHANEILHTMDRLEDDENYEIIRNFERDDN